MLVWGTQNRLSQSLTTSELTNRLHPFTTQHVVVGLIHHHRLATLHPHSRTSLQHTDESSHLSLGYRRLNYNALSHSCFINHSDWPATKHKPWTQSWLANTIFFYPEDCPAFQQHKLSSQKRASRGLFCTRISLVTSLLTLQSPQTTVGHIQITNKR